MKYDPEDVEDKTYEHLARQRVKNQVRLEMRKRTPDDDDDVYEIAADMPGNHKQWGITRKEFSSARKSAYKALLRSAAGKGD